MSDLLYEWKHCSSNRIDSGVSRKWLKLNVFNGAFDTEYFEWQNGVRKCVYGHLVSHRVNQIDFIGKLADASSVQRETTRQCKWCQLNWILTNPSNDPHHARSVCECESEHQSTLLTSSVCVGERGKSKKRVNRWTWFTHEITSFSVKWLTSRDERDVHVSQSTLFYSCLHVTCVKKMKASEYSWLMKQLQRERET